jgi:AraC family transcriptional regulator
MLKITVPLGAPPRIAIAGIGVHGVGTSHDRFQLPHLWQLHRYRYTADYAVDGERLRITPGSISLVPPGSVVDYWYRGRAEHIYLHFDLPGADAEAGTDAEAEAEAKIKAKTKADAQFRDIQVLTDARIAAPLLDDLLGRAMSAHVGESGAQAQAHLWSALWRLAELTEETATERLRHPAVQAAIDHIEAHLADGLTVAGIAKSCGISHNHLTRLFSAQLDTTVVAYIRSRRMARARHLLTASTLPVAAVAGTVGVPDLQAFNKLCRRTFGVSPRTLRERGE